MRPALLPIALLLALTFAACTADGTSEGFGGSGGIGAGGAGGSGAGEAGGGGCFGLGYCACAEASACRVVAEACFCPCGEYACEEKCLCGCAGGAYLGCAPADCPVSTCPEGHELVQGADGCPTCEPLPPCAGMEPCECFEAAHCRPLADACICECDYDCAGREPCDCGCGGGMYLGCHARDCRMPSCTEAQQLELGADGCPVCVPAGS